MPRPPSFAPVLGCALLLLAAAPARAHIAFQSRSQVDLGSEVTAAVFAGGAPQRPLVATGDGLAALRYDHGELVPGDRSRDGRGARILAASDRLAAFGTREAARISLARLDSGAAPSDAEAVELPAAPRAAQVLPSAAATPAVAVLHDQGLSIVTRTDTGWQRREVAAPRFGADLAVLDADGHGRVTLVVADEAGSVLRLLHGSADGGIDGTETRATARAPRRLLVADLDRDGGRDLLVVADDGLYVHRAGADRRLGPPEAIWRSPQVADAGVADLSGDGRPDIVLADRSAGAAVVLFADATGRFTAGDGYLVGSAPERVLAGDVDGDGHADAIVFDRLAGGATWLRGRGDGTLAGVPCTLGRFGALVAMVSEDFDGDEHPDLAAISEESGALGVFLGVGDGRFRPLPPIDIGRRPRALAVGDFNQDEKPDLAVVAFNGDEVAVLLGLGEGRFAPPRSVKVGGGPVAISVGSFASPLSVDLAVVNSLSDSVSILYGDGHGGFPSVVSQPVPARPTFLIVGDTNQDGNQDLVVGSAYSPTIAILLGNGHGLDAPTSTTLGGTAQPAAAEDLDRDGQMDLINPDALGGAVEVRPGERPGEFGRPIRLAVGRAPQALATGDFDRDGRIDIAVADRAGSTIAILLNRSPAPTPPRGHGDGPA